MWREALCGMVVAGCGEAASPTVTTPVAVVTVPSSAAPAEAGCEPATDYVAVATPSGRAPDLPPLPMLPSTPLKTTSGFTVFGAIHLLRSEMRSAEVTSTPISVVGYVVDSNIPRAPACAIHRSTKADAAGCEPEVPSFWIADDKGAVAATKIRVVGWAHGFGAVFDAMTVYKKLTPGVAPKTPVKDDMLGVSIPFPLPAVGMRVKVTGTYGFSAYVGASAVREPLGGVMKLTAMDVLEPAPAPAAFGGKTP